MGDTPYFSRQLTTIPDRLAGRFGIGDAFFPDFQSLGLSVSQSLASLQLAGQTRVFVQY